ncbi:ATP-binding protein [Actinomadura rupiterrae]|uniref:ATP-binding protein n=1 Tax=Actinomadura rupiterrae TaxID=559627 RepID=UPI0020A3ED84|nr:ATP-binding protein [Actinomadura rupiterrae]MCP2335907.1 anti-sigma regulatory factor (Ser/Thr protein kinase) [Actinomadura rupiterrae]
MVPRPVTPASPRTSEAAPSFEQAVTGVASAAVLVRNLVEAHLNSWGMDALVDDAVLVADELFANAAQAAPGQVIGLRVVLLAAFVLIEVEDPSPKRAAHREPDDEGGRGLMIVEALSAYWGQRPERGGTKTVYALLAIPRSA